MLDIIPKITAFIVVGVVIFNIAIYPIAIVYGLASYALSWFYVLGATCAAIAFASILLGTIVNALCFVRIYRHLPLR